MIPEELGIAERVFVPTTAMAVGVVEIGVGVSVGDAVEDSRNTAESVFEVVTASALEVDVSTGIDSLMAGLVV